MTHDERARSAFIVGLKKKANLSIAVELESRFHKKIVPALQQKLGRPLDDTSREDRKAVIEALKNEQLYRLWAYVTYLSQGVKWELVEEIFAKDLPRLQAAADHFLSAPDKKCTLTLNPDLKIPANIAKVEIHRQPGGFSRETHARDIAAGAKYNFGATMGPSAGQGRAGFKPGRSAGDFVAETIKARYPALKPKRILEVGCGTGRNTPSYTRQFPEAEVVAIDCAPGLLRWACAFAESQGAAIHFKQMDATDLEFADGHFDMVVSHILGHEMTTQGLPKMIAESWRVLAPGGVMFHADVAIQPGHINLFDQALNQWQVRHNGEPFWMGWADADVGGLMKKAGIPAADMFTEYMSSTERGGEWFCYGAHKAQKQRVVP
ncbi:MAG: class I SAM-dependent methyltransferase [Rhodospirillaceae bacterium]|nr:class I SAM-dependent methyltransferase [Rhodospirillaceae bacterium]